MESMNLIRIREDLCDLLVKTALIRQKLDDMQDKTDPDTDREVALICAVSSANILQMQIMNAITIE